MITISIKTSNSEYALLKTEDEEYANGIFMLCQMRLGDLYPGAMLKRSASIRDWERLEMHPEKARIFDRMRELEFPFPTSEMVIEGELA